MSESTIRQATEESLRRIRFIVCENNVSEKTMTYCRHGNWTGLSAIGWDQGTCKTCRLIDKEFEWLKEKREDD